MINTFSAEGQLYRAQKYLNKLEYNGESSLKIKNAQDKVDILQGRLDNKRAIKVAKAGATKIDKSKNIGNVIFVVEGGRPATGGTELRLLKKIFSDLLVRCQTTHFQ